MISPWANRYWQVHLVCLFFAFFFCSSHRNPIRISTNNSSGRKRRLLVEYFERNKNESLGAMHSHMACRATLQNEHKISFVQWATMYQTQGSNVLCTSIKKKVIEFSDNRLQSIFLLCGWLFSFSYLQFFKIDLCFSHHPCCIFLFYFLASFFTFERYQIHVRAILLWMFKR